mmetsp:Transcript_63922/g.101348  ORF Transcript_63922/g.101348 Transcript_63922/m.101348 type:complete len:223 (+) Transcript_63922:376-1044(+)
MMRLRCAIASLKRCCRLVVMMLRCLIKLRNFFHIRLLLQEPNDTFRSSCSRIIGLCHEAMAVFCWSQEFDVWERGNAKLLTLFIIFSRLPMIIVTLSLFEADKRGILSRSNVGLPLFFCIRPNRIQRLAMRASRRVIVHQFRICHFTLATRYVQRIWVNTCLRKLHKLVRRAFEKKIVTNFGAWSEEFHCGETHNLLLLALLVIGARLPIIVQALLLLPNHF